METDGDEHSNIVEHPSLSKFEEHGHIALIGPTNSGKTWRFKSFACDNKYEDYETFVYVGPPKQLTEVAKSYCGSLLLKHKDYTQGHMCYYKLDDLELALQYCTSEENKQKKLLFLDDALILSTQLSKKISTWIHQAKNYNTTVVISVHEAFGTQVEKMVRTACRYYVGLNLNPQQISKLVNLPTDAKALKQIEATEDPHDQYFIFDKISKHFFNNQYKTFE